MSTNISSKGLTVLLFVLAGLSAIELYGQDSIEKASSNNTKYEFSYALSIGGESKLALLFPKLNLARKHEFPKLNVYYGIGAGIHVHFLGGWGTLNGFCGLEKKRFDLESSYSYLWISEIKRSDKPSMRPCKQNLINLKVGYKFTYSKLRLVTSYIISEMTPHGQERNPLLDIGRIHDNFILGVEFTSIINRD